jgi:hypothetical protein
VHGDCIIRTWDAATEGWALLKMHISGWIYGHGVQVTFQILLYIRPMDTRCRSWSTEVIHALWCMLYDFCNTSKGEDDLSYGALLYTLHLTSLWVFDLPDL